MLGAIVRSSRASSLARGICCPARLHRNHVASFQPRQLSCSNVRLFTSSVSRWDAGTTDHALSAALQEELKYEQETAENIPSIPDFLKAFREKGIWKMADEPGRDDIVLTRTYGNEKIRVEFSVVDLMNPSEESEFDDIEESSAKETEETEDPAYTPSYPIRVNVVISKSETAGVLAMEAAVQDGTFVIEGASFFQDASLATDSSAEADWKRRSLYLGPQYDRLEVGLQEKFDEYLKERGVGEELAMFIPEYAEWKEQKEYVSWLRNVKQFVDV